MALMWVVFSALVFVAVAVPSVVMAVPVALVPT